MSLDITLEDPTATYETCVFETNITHNLSEMAEKAEIYKAIWCPDEIKPSPKAKDIIPLIESGLDLLKKDPNFYKIHNAFNGWGTYNDFIPFLEEYLDALKTYPEAKIIICK